VTINVGEAAALVLKEAGSPLHAREIRTRMAIQIKKWKCNVQAPVVQQVRGSLGTHEQGLIITTSDFSPGERTEAARSDAVPIALMNGEQLVVLLVENGIGVTRRSHDLIELDDAVGGSRET
jgi:restriction system protein